MWYVNNILKAEKNSPQYCTGLADSPQNYRVEEVSHGCVGPNAFMTIEPFNIAANEISGPDEVCLYEPAPFSLPFIEQTEYNWISDDFDIIVEPQTPNKVWVQIDTVLNNNTEGQLFCTLVNKCGTFELSKSLSIINEPGAIIDMFEDIEVCLGDTVVLKPFIVNADHIEWYEGEKLIGEDVDSILFSPEHTSKLKIIAYVNMEHCPVEKSINVFVKECDTTTTTVAINTSEKTKAVFTCFVSKPCPKRSMDFFS